jgi:hypothetical protein
MKETYRKAGLEKSRVPASHNAGQDLVAARLLIKNLERFEPVANVQTQLNLRATYRSASWNESP